MTQVVTQEHWLQTPRGQLFVKIWTPASNRGVPLVLLHDSLGCVELWRDFPERLAQATGRRVIAYDRLGFGRSDPHPGSLSASFIEDEANQDFLSVCRQLELGKYVVFGHSVGGGMAIGCASAHPNACMGVITESAQAFVDAGIVEGIRAAKRQFANAEQMERLKKYHGEKAAWVLDAWTETWLAEDFSRWSLDRQLPKVRCPALILHGDRDEFGSARHPARIAELVSGPASMQMLTNCGHVPHREYPDAVLEAVAAFLAPALVQGPG
jgi:pimeloyl-ACP methyl ester carboxylesterase